MGDMNCGPGTDAIKEYQAYGTKLCNNDGTFGGSKLDYFIGFPQNEWRLFGFPGARLPRILRAFRPLRHHRHGRTEQLEQRKQPETMKNAKEIPFGFAGPRSGSTDVHGVRQRAGRVPLGRPDSRSVGQIHHRNTVRLAAGRCRTLLRSVRLRSRARLYRHDARRQERLVADDPRPCGQRRSPVAYGHRVRLLPLDDLRIQPDSVQNRLPGEHALRKPVPHGVEGAKPAARVATSPD